MRFDKDLSISQLVRSHIDISRKLCEVLIVDCGATVRECGVHLGEPTIANFGCDVKVNVTHPQSRVAADLVVRRRTTPILSEKQGQMIFGFTEVPGIQRTQNEISFHAFVEVFDETIKKFLSADTLVKGIRRHADTLDPPAVCSTMAFAQFLGTRV